MTKSLIVLLAFVAIQGCIWNVASMPQQSALNLWLMTDTNLNYMPDHRNDALCTGAADGFYAYAGQCGPDYYACIENIFYPQTCPNGGVFDPLTLKCVSPSATSCKTTIPTTTTTTTARTTAKPFSCPADGNYAIGSCSSSYYTCIGGVVYPQTCPPNSVFEPSVLMCISEATAPCKMTTTTTTTQAPFTCKGDGFYEIAPCMHNYYVCIEGQQYLQECPGDGIFVGPPTSACKREEDTTCSSTTGSPATSTTSSTATPTISTSGATISTSGATESTSGATISTSSPTQSTANPTESTSGATESTSGATTSTSGPTQSTANPTESTVATPKPFLCPSDGFFASTPPDVCSGIYYYCSGGVAHKLECPPPNVFDPQLGGCTGPSGASCNNQLTKQTELDRFFSWTKTGVGKIWSAFF